MIIFVKKWNSILIALTFLFVLGALGLVCRSVCVYPVSGVACSGKKIVIDAGHGDPDGGAVGISGVLEKDLNLKIAKYLQAYLEENGAEVMMTRTGDAGLFDSKSGTVREKKRADLQTRVKLMNESDAELLVSVHMNKFTDGRYSGPQVFYAESTDVSKQLAEVIQAELISQLQPPSERTIKPGKDIYLLKHAKVPAVLVECGFLSNEKEETLLQDEDYQKRVAWALYCGIEKFLEA